jgi:hypothetical protein
MFPDTYRTDIPVNYVTAYGKKWLFEPYSMILQCAYCIYTQSMHPVRDDTGLVIALKMDTTMERHGEDCPQKTEGLNSDPQ